MANSKPTYYLKLLWSFLILILFAPTVLLAQISAGGKPLATKNSILVKSNFNHQIIMPKLSFNQMAKQTTNKLPLYKSLKFGHSFKVNLTPDNSGQVFHTEYFKIWQVEIVSEGAYSINLVFDKYHLPPGARLFVFNENQNIVLGAFTSRNNKASNILAVHPLPGDKIIVQYEEPLNSDFKGEISIGTVVHAYLDVLNEKNLFYPRRQSGSCNVDVQCENESNMEMQKKAICRVFAIDELGTATLINTAKEDGTPYLLSAYHVFDNMSNSDSALFSFNYESPYCTGLEGYDYHSISGAHSVAGRIETDMILMELSETPPASFRPYYVGWDATNTPPENCYCIHHPNGDTKKISHDTGICEITRYQNSTITNGHWKVLNWETGTTEGGSSGAGLFDNNGHLVGTLSGGRASCTEKDYDVFARFDIMYDYFSLSNSQLKHWLNPDNLQIETLDGYDPYAQDQINCITISNFTTEDSATTLTIDDSYLTGNNDLGITEIASSFSQLEKGTLEGISIGISKLEPYGMNPKINVKIYSTALASENLIYTQEVKFEDLLKNAFNYIKLNNSIDIKGKFFVGIELPISNDSITLYHSQLKPDASSNNFYLKINDSWKELKQFLNNSSTASLLMDVNVCSFHLKNVSDKSIQKLLAKITPNPASTFVEISFLTQGENKVIIYNAVGDCIFKQKYNISQQAMIDVSNFKNGVYFVQVRNKSDIQTIKFFKK